MKAIKTGSANAEKKPMRIAALFLFSVFLAGSMVDAQIDPSSAMLLNPGKSNARDSGLDSGRYTVKPKSEPRLVRKTEPRMRADEPAPTPPPVFQTPGESATASETASTAIAAPLAPQATPKAPQKTPEQPPENRPQQVSSQETGPQFEPQEPVEPQHARSLRDDRRTTMLELSFAPGYLYNESKSTFAPRNYFANSPAASVDATVWVNPKFGVHTAFTGTLNANVSDSLDNTKNATAASQWFSAGAKARSFFGEGPKAPVLQFGVDYREYAFKTPSDSLLRNKLTTSGLHFLLDAELPTGAFGSWTFGGEFGPQLSHRESSNGLEFRSGQNPLATAVEVHAGAKFRFNRTNAMFWKISYGVERDLFSGATSINDPVTGQPQTDVAVTNAFTLFLLGYTWGD